MGYFNEVKLDVYHYEDEVNNSSLIINRIVKSQKELVESQKELVDAQKELINKIDKLIDKYKIIRDKFD